MAHGLMYIPLSLLTTASLNKIYNNDNIKFIKVPNSIMNQTLDPAQFGNEEELTIQKWW